jgi:hypothetical protein
VGIEERIAGMAQKLSSKAMKKLDTLTEARRKWDRVHSLVEMAATQKTGQDMYLSQMKRASEDVARVFMNGGYGPLAGNANELALLVKRGGSLQYKLRAMRETVGNVFAAIDRAEKAVMDEEKAGAAD